MAHARPGGRVVIADAKHSSRWYTRSFNFIADLPFADEEFTVVTTAFMLLYLTPAEKQRAIAEIHRVLAPGGRLGCLSSLGEIADVFLIREEWEGLLGEAGFGDVQIEELYDVFRLVAARKGA